MARHLQLAMRPPIKAASSIWDGFPWEIQCPVCGFEYTHIERCGTLSGSDYYESRIYPGTEQVGTTDERRSAIEIVFYCEDGHRWALVIQQHKGINGVGVERLDDLTEEEVATGKY